LPRSATSGSLGAARCAVIAAFTYDALGRRQTKTVGGVASGYVYDRANIVQELTGAAGSNNDPANVKASYISSGIDEVFAQLSGTGANATILTYFTDALGSPMRQAPRWLTIHTTGTASRPPMQPSATGRENDGTGLYYYRARYYSTTLARFIQSDPIGPAGG
jgi:uncharacterized protein RhaS with RHS repeats